MEYHHFKLDLVQLGGLLLSVASAYLMIRKANKRKAKEKSDENDQASGG